MKLEPSMQSGIVIRNLQVAPGHFLMDLRLPAAFPSPMPGQFLMVRLSERNEPFLRRPLSIHTFRRRKDSVTLGLLYRVTGKGTLLFSRQVKGAAFDILGPLGQPFRILPSCPTVILMSGGIGVAPLTYLAHHYRRTNLGNRMASIIIYVGAKDAKTLVGLKNFKEMDLRISTDDGSMGFHGPVTSLFEQDLATYDPENSMIYVCGPSAMIRRLSEILEGTGFACQVLMEERMACGIGACLGCVTAVRDNSGKVRYERVCREGPVFDIRNLIRD
jgi:dihydroorotate dehydrogenase electron transfer subunit